MYYDAIICQRELDISVIEKWKMGSFHQTHSEEFAKKLVEKGYKVAVLDQVESGRSIERKIRSLDSEDVKKIKDG